MNWSKLKTSDRTADAIAAMKRGERVSPEQLAQFDSKIVLDPATGKIDLARTEEKTYNKNTVHGFLGAVGVPTTAVAPLSLASIGLVSTTTALGGPVLALGVAYLALAAIERAKEDRVAIAMYLKHAPDQFVNVPDHKTDFSFEGADETADSFELP